MTMTVIVASRQQFKRDLQVAVSAAFFVALARPASRPRGEQLVTPIRIMNFAATLTASNPDRGRHSRC
jgi:hypothetical protein